jgi:hypothetical protein
VVVRGLLEIDDLKSRGPEPAKETKAKLALTIWYEGVDNQNRPALVEISFSYETDHGEVPAEAARRARQLLLVMQDLDWAKPMPTKPRWPPAPIHLLRATGLKLDGG